MNIYAISLVRNEIDIIETNLREASKWATKIFVLDNGSDDGTWEKVNELSRENEAIVPWKQDTTPYFDGIRANVYNEFKHLAKTGDWWCFKLDADEFYLDDPRDFLRQVPAKNHFVCSDAIEFQLTKEDIEELQFDGNFKTDRNKIQYYLPTTWAEARFFRFRKRMEWDPVHHMPKHMGIVYPGKIRLLHYQYRSPQQMSKRVSIRKEATKRGWWLHERVESWEDLLKSREGLLKADRLPEIETQGCRNNHLHKPYVYLAKRFLHGLGILP